MRLGTCPSSGGKKAKHAGHSPKDCLAKPKACMTHPKTPLATSPSWRGSGQSPAGPRPSEGDTAKVPANKERSFPQWLVYKPVMTNYRGGKTSFLTASESTDRQEGSLSPSMTGLQKDRQGGHLVSSMATEPIVGKGASSPQQLVCGLALVIILLAGAHISSQSKSQ